MNFENNFEHNPRPLREAPEVYRRRRLGALAATTMFTLLGVRVIDMYNGPECSNDTQELYVGDNGINTVWEIANTINRGADVRGVVRVILDMNPQLEPGNLQYGELVVTPTECSA